MGKNSQVSPGLCLNMIKERAGQLVAYARKKLNHFLQLYQVYKNVHLVPFLIIPNLAVFRGHFLLVFSLENAILH